MTEEGFKRKLSAILSADVEGYSLLMSDNEEATIRTLTAYRQVVAQIVRRYRGRIVDTPGDNILAEFASVVDAVNCSLEVQRELAERNAELPKTRRMQFRIGVNLGDVVEEKSRIYGDGVNIAARVESIADPGGICISGTAYDQVENKLEVEYKYLGKYQVKNIRRPIRAYRVLSVPGAAASRVVRAKKAVMRKWRNGILVTAVCVVAVAVISAGWYYFQHRSEKMETADVERMRYPLPDKPSLAVLPFTNLSGDPQQEYLADAISESIISALSSTPRMFVISRNSTFIFKNQSVRIKEISEKLGVRFVMEGSVMREGDRVRVTAQLIDAVDGYHRWTQTYDREMSDVLNLLDDITREITVAVEGQLTYGDQTRSFTKGTDNFEVFLGTAKGAWHLDQVSREDNAKAHVLLKKATALDSQYSYAWALRAHAHFTDARMGWSESAAESLKKGVFCVQKALALDDSNFIAHVLMGEVYLMQKAHAQAIAECEKAVRLSPGSANAHWALGRVLRFTSRPQEAVAHHKKALRLAPYGPWYYLSNLGQDYFFLRRYREAIPIFKQVLERCLKDEGNPKFPYLYLSMTYSELGQMQEARQNMRKVLEYDPGFNLATRRQQLYYHDPAVIERYITALRNAGAPQHPPSQ